MKFAFLIAGVQKAGTTALHHFLSAHPQLFLPKKKELHFFDNENIDWSDPPYHAYHNIIPPPPARLPGEATPIYTYWAPSLARIRAYNPQINLVVLLRDPVARAFSHWRMEIFRKKETLDFHKAITSGRARVIEQAEVENCHRIFSYVERGFYANQIDRIWSCFAKEQVLFLPKMALMRRHRETLDEVCEFLHVNRFTEYPPPERIFSFENTSTDRPSQKCISYLRDVYREDFERCQNMIGREIEVEAP